MSSKVLSADEAIAVFGNLGTARDGTYTMQSSQLNYVVSTEPAKNNGHDRAPAGLEALSTEGTADDPVVVGTKVPGFLKVVVQTEGLKNPVKQSTECYDTLIVYHQIPTDSETVQVHAYEYGVLTATKVDGSVVGKGAIAVTDEYIVQCVSEDTPTDYCPGAVGVKAATEDPSEGQEPLSTSPANGIDPRLTLTLQDYKCVYDGDEGLNIGGTGVHSLALQTLQLAADEVTEKTACFIAEGTVEEGMLPIGTSHVGSTVIVDGLKATEPNVCPGDLEIEAASLKSILDSGVGTLVTSDGEIFEPMRNELNVISGAATVLNGHLENATKGVCAFETEADENLYAHHVGAILDDKGGSTVNLGCASSAEILVLDTKLV